MICAQVFLAEDQYIQWYACKVSLKIRWICVDLVSEKGQGLHNIFKEYLPVYFINVE